jgi:membrane protein
VLVGLALTTVLFTWTYTTLGHSHPGWRDHVPGALVVAVGFEILKVVGSIYIPHAVASSSALYGSLGIVFAVLAWLLLFGRLLVYSAVLNVTRYEKHEGTVRAVVEAPPIPGARPRASRSGRLVTADN